ncbi:hypothetical protein [Glaciecola sp. HTCC2999]|uniref:hypothetical protein n=1 Tax=Glaciecola sp. HTCC2999 TaxID=455436 RepID=UPI0000E0EF24|nr:hypothetical protein [Glaciecola sp. HTCC2999]
MKILKILFLLIIVSLLPGCSGGNCDYPDDRAKDGSRCGARAASLKPGGRNPDTDWVKYLLLGVGAVWLTSSLFSSSNSKKGSRSYKKEEPKKTLKPLKTKTPIINKKTHKQNPQNTISTDEVKNNLFVYFDLIIEPEFESIFQAIVNQVVSKNGNNYDASSRYVFAYIGSFDGIPGQKIDKRVDQLTRSLIKNQSKAILYESDITDIVNIIRETRGLQEVN